jgi:putative hydrolase of the HAD superfamily
MLRAAVFDFGGTLVDYGPETVLGLLPGFLRGARAGHAWLRAHGHRPPLFPRFLAGAARAVLGGHRRAGREQEEFDAADAVRELLARGGTRLDDRELEELSLAWREPFERSARRDPDALPLIAALRARGLRTGLITNTYWKGGVVRRVLARHGLDRAFDAVAISCELRVRKPAPAIFLHLLGELGVAPGEAVYVGNQPREDVGGPAAVGMRAILKWPAGVPLPPGAPRPDAIVTRLAEIPRVIEKWY